MIKSRKNLNSVNTISSLPASHFSPWYPTSQPEIHEPLTLSQAWSSPAQLGLQISEQFSPYVRWSQAVTRKERSFHSVFVDALKRQT